MRTTAFFLLFTLTAFTAGCKSQSAATNTGGGGSPDGPGGGSGIEGTYITADLEIGGKKVTPKQLANMGLDKPVTITADTITYKRPSGRDDVQKYKLDATKTPAEIDVTMTYPDGKSDTLYAIYKLEGDTLTIATAGPVNGKRPEAKDRPKEFKTKAGSFDFLHTLKKQ